MIPLLLSVSHIAYIYIHACIPAGLLAACFSCLCVRAACSSREHPSDAIRGCDSHYIPPYSDDLVESDQIIRLGRIIFPYSSTPCQINCHVQTLLVQMSIQGVSSFLHGLSIINHKYVQRVIIEFAFKIYIISSPVLPSSLSSHTLMFSRREISSSSTQVFTRPLCFLTFSAP
jgi:hypothetical protein